MHPWEISSDDEPLVLGALRNVAPRLMECEPATQIDQDSSGTVPPTVPATPGALVEVGREPPFDQVGDAETHDEDMLDALAVDLEVDNGARSLDDSVGPEDQSEVCIGHQGIGDSSSDVQELQMVYQCGQRKLFEVSSSERPESIQRVDGRR